MERMEWLCFQLVNAVYDALMKDDCKHLKVLSARMDMSSAHIVLDIAWAAHKMVHDGFAMKSKACDANDRADFYLVGRLPGGEHALVLLEIYHTTNVPENTCSNRRHVIIPETRILVTSLYPLLHIVDACFKSIADEVPNRYCLSLSSDSATALSTNIVDKHCRSICFIS